MRAFATLTVAVLVLTASWIGATPPGPNQPFDCSGGGTSSCATDDTGCVPDTKDREGFVSSHGKGGAFSDSVRAVRGGS